MAELISGEQPRTAFDFYGVEAPRQRLVPKAA
jgi:hypothetical protein